MHVFDSNKNNFRKVWSYDREKANGEIPFVPNTSLRESKVWEGIIEGKVNLKTKK